MATKQQILKGRLAVDAYRIAHTLLHSQPWTPDVPDAHTPLLNTMLAKFKGQGFNSLDEFFQASALLNQQDLADGVITADGVWK